MADDEKSGDEKKEEDGKKEEKKEGQKKKGDEKKDRKLLWPWIVGAVVVLGFVAVVLYIIFAPAPDVWTDDSYVTAHYASVAPRVSGQVVEVAVDDNQAVKA
ncbi:MAG: biotin/lipoyl-binding protein, partial [Janthinobacterium lividum]